MFRSIRELTFLKEITRSIAFLPSLITLLMFGMGMLMWYLESMGVSNLAEEFLPYILFNNLNTARSVLNVLTTGMFSLMIFSFTMVMVVTGQAISNISPRVIPGFIANPKHQFVLGFYLGTIVYLLIIMISVKSNWNPYSVPAVSIILGTIFTFVCLGLFVFFMHSINQSIQVDKIAAGLYRKTIKKMDGRYENDHEDYINPELDILPYVVNSRETGFLTDVDEEQLTGFCRENETSVEIIFPPGTFIMAGTPLLRCSLNLSEHPALLEKLNDFLLISTETISERYPFHGMMLLKEVAEKALSPGLNDPYTAVKIIYMTGDLLRLKMNHPGLRIHYAENGNYCLLRDTDYAFMLNWGFDTLREYGKNNVQVMAALMAVCVSLADVAEDEKYRRETLLQLEKIAASADAGIKVPGDREAINGYVAIIKNKWQESDIEFLKLT